MNDFSLLTGKLPLSATAEHLHIASYCVCLSNSCLTLSMGSKILTSGCTCP